jgi:Asp-tRNA(Asn)/Glu-tRNA(Gln) amidotransferase A subunit family amidase
MAYEMARSLAWERINHRELLSANLQRLLEQGEAVDPDDYDRVVEGAAVARGAAADSLFGEADVLLTFAADGEAPEGLTHTGAPRFARLWTLLGFPTIAVPGMTGSTGLPVGVQLVGRRGEDARVLACARWLAAALPPAPIPVLG